MSPVLQQEIQNLSFSEKIQLVQDLWDEIAATDTEMIPLSEAQQQELEQRLQAHQNHPDAASSWAEVKNRIVNP